MRSRRQDAHGLLRGKKNSFGAKGIIGEAASWRVIDDTAFGRESRCSYLRLKLPSGIPTQVVVPSVSLAALLQGTAPTVFVETPSSATLFKPVSDPEISGPPTSGARPTGGGIAGDSGAVAGGAVPVVCCANVADDKRARAAATGKVILRMPIEASFNCPTPTSAFLKTSP